MNQESKNYQPKKQLKQTETRICQNCGKEFTIEPEDFEFYEKIGVPAPTFCPDCRLQRRMMWRNERKLYKRKCDLCGKDIISIYPPDAPFPVYCSKCWNSDKWDPMDYGREYDWDKPFFEQIEKLYKKVPHLSLMELNNTNCPFVNYAWFSNNSYMCFDLGYGEDMMYSKACHFVKDSIDCSYAKKIELCYECVEVEKSNHSSFLKNCENCLDSHFLTNCKNCSSCILCEN
ncbi:MAG TPA: hypothetical protein ENL06_02590, partial [Candidatus Portnoybacteria bacterium]|nr:hypothetical protein [Candidatus Portnoybacteria bacterium]